MPNTQIAALVSQLMDHGLPISAYRSHPLVLGVVGRPAESVKSQYFDQAPGARTLVRTDHMEVRAIGPVDGRGMPGFYWGSALPAAGPLSDWREVSENLCAAGLIRQGEDWVLFTDSIGVHSVYVRKHSGSIYFSTRLAPLVAILGPLSVDWEAWSSILLMGSPLGPTTPFLEIRRLEAASGLLIKTNGTVLRRSFAPRWLSQPEVGNRLDDLIDALRAALPPRSALRQPPAVPLSAGWDSRLLGGLASGNYLGHLMAWTTDPDDGRDLDLTYAPAVADALGMRHTSVGLPDSGWPQLAAETRYRVQFETWLHPWFTPLSQRVRDRECDVLDGLAGGVLIRAAFVDAEMLRASDQQRLEGLFERLCYRPGRLNGHLHGDAADASLELCRQSFFGIADRFNGHVNQLALTVLHTRTARAIALSPLCLLAPEVRPWFPFLHPQVLGISLSIDPASKVDGALYRELLTRGATQAANHPSTNDPDKGPPDRTRQLKSGAEATEWMIASILLSDLAAKLLHRDAISAMRAGRNPAKPLSFHMGLLLQAASLLAHWERLYGHRLSSTTPPW